MRKSNLKKNHEPFDSAVERYRTFAEKIVSAQRVVSTAEEKRDIAESVLLRLCAHWEQFIDEHWSIASIEITASCRNISRSRFPITPHGTYATP